MKRSIMFGTAIAAAMALTSVSTADVIFNNFGAGDTYQIGTGWTLSDGAPIGVDNDQGDAFTVSGGNFFLDQIDVAIGLVTGTNRIFLDLYDDAGGQPGSVLESAVIDGQMGQFGQNNPPIVAVFSGTTLLADGVQYWVIASTDSNTWAAWNWNSIGDVGPHAFRQNMGAWATGNNTRGAFRVIGTLPAPGALALFGLAGLGARRRRRV